MRIAFYAPFKPLGHKNPSGDLVIATSLVEYLKQCGHTVEVQSKLRTRWIYLKPWLWPLLVFDLFRILFRLHTDPPDLWLTYHTYYKAPDVIGPWVCRMLGTRYAIFQGIYSTKQKRRFKTWPGFYLNRSALKRADHVFTNKAPDLENLKRLIPSDRLTYIRPGIQPGFFKEDEVSGGKNRLKWCGKDDTPVILTAAMFREDVKTQGLIWLIDCLASLAKKRTFHLVIAGSGKTEDELKRLAAKKLPGCHTFAGQIHRKEMPGFYSGGDLFAFPGINESLGMVFIEAQSCGLPVVAFNNGGLPEVVRDRITGFLVNMYDCRGFAGRLDQLLGDKRLAENMGRAAIRHVGANHDIEKNYILFERTLARMAEPAE